MILYFALPESIRFCVRKNERDPRIPDLLRRMNPALALSGGERFVLNEPPATGMPVAALFRDGRATVTALIWLAYFMNILVINVLGAFLPTFLRNFGGLSMEHAAGITSFYSISGIVAMLGYGRLIDLFGAPKVIALTGIVAAAAVAALGLIDLQSPWLYVVTFFVGAGVIAGQGGLHALCSMLYPTRVRATGIGWALGAGRFGGMLGAPARRDGIGAALGGAADVLRCRPADAAGRHRGLSDRSGADLARKTRDQARGRRAVMSAVRCCYFTGAGICSNSFNWSAVNGAGMNFWLTASATI